MATLPVKTSEVPVEESPVEESPVLEATPEIPPVIAEPEEPLEDFSLFSTGFEDEEETQTPVLSEAEQAKQELLQASGNEPPPTGAPVAPTTEGEKAKAELLGASGNVDTYSGLAIVNAGIADILDLAPDTIITISNALVSGVGLDKVVGLLPTGSFRRLMELTGSTLPEENLPQGVLAEGLRFLGQSVGGLPILGRILAAKAFQMGGKVIGGKGLIREGTKTLGHTLKTSATETPFTFVASDLAAGFGAGLSFGVAKEAGVENPTGLFLSTLVGGVTPAVSLQLLKSLRFGVWGLANSVRKANFTEHGGNIKAAKRVKSQLSNADEAARKAEIREEIRANEKLRAEDPANAPKVLDRELPDDGLLPKFKKALTPAQDMDNELLPLERAIMESTPGLKKKYGEQHEILNDIIIKSFDEGGDVVVTRNELMRQKTYLEELWNERLRMARVDAQEEIASLGPKADPVDQSRIVKKHLDLALKDAEKHQTKMWELAGDSEHISSSPLTAVWERLLREKRRMSKSSDFKFREDANHLFEQLGRLDDNGNFVRGAMGETESLQELQALRSAILDELRGAAAKDNSSNKIRILNEIQKTIIHMMEEAEAHVVMVKNAEGVFEAQEPSNSLLRAIAVSKQFNMDFNQGIVKELLSTNTDGSPAVPITQTLENIFAGSPQETSDNFTNLLKAIARERDPSKNPLLGQDLDPMQIQPVTEAAKVYIKSFFFRNFTHKGRISGERAAMKWIDDNRETLKQIPGLHKELREAVRSGDTLSLMESENKMVQQILTNPDRAAAVRFIQADTDVALDQTAAINLKRSRVRDAKILKRRAQRDPSGEAYRGLRQGVMDWILKNSLDSDGSFVSGAKMTIFLKNLRTKDIIDNILTAEDKVRLDMVVRSARKLDVIRNTPALKEVIEKGWVGALAGRLGGARLGNWLNNKWGGAGGGDIQTPSALAKQGSRFVDGLLKDFPRAALIDAFTAESPDQLDALLTLPTTAQNVSRLQNAFSIWFAKIAVLYNINVADFEDPQDRLKLQLQLSEELE